MSEISQRQKVIGFSHHMQYRRARLLMTGRRWAAVRLAT